MAMIEKGMDLSLLYKKAENSPPVNFWVIKIGLLMVGIAIGVLVASMIANNLMDEDSAYPTMILLFGGLALLASYFVERKLRQDNK
jgi:magnesium-transporting ATPase (P-type)